MFRYLCRTSRDTSSQLNKDDFTLSEDATPKPSATSHAESGLPLTLGLAGGYQRQPAPRPRRRAQASYTFSGRCSRGPKIRRSCSFRGRGRAAAGSHVVAKKLEPPSSCWNRHSIVLSGSDAAPRGPGAAQRTRRRTGSTMRFCSRPIAMKKHRPQSVSSCSRWRR